MINVETGLVTFFNIDDVLLVAFDGIDLCGQDAGSETIANCESLAFAVGSFAAFVDTRNAFNPHESRDHGVAPTFDADTIDFHHGNFAIAIDCQTRKTIGITEDQATGVSEFGVGIALGNGLVNCLGNKAGSDFNVGIKRPHASAKSRERTV